MLTGETPEILLTKPEALDVSFAPYLRAFQLLQGSRKIDRTVGSQGSSITIHNLEFSDITEYTRTFPDDVDDIRRFIKFIQAIDQEFQEYGLRKSKT